MKKILEYDILRVFVTILVVVGHINYWQIITDYGGIDYSDMFAGDVCILYRGVNLLSAVIYSFHMPLFMALSGALFYLSMEKGRFPSLKILVQSKARRLLIPYFCVTICYSVPVKAVSGYYENSENVLKDILLGQVLDLGNTHLWFLLVLFFIFILDFLVQTYVKLPYTIKIVFLYLLRIVFLYVRIPVISSIFEYWLWFAVGFLFEPRRTDFNSSVNVRKTVQTAAVYLVLLVPYIVTQHIDGGSWKPVITACKRCFLNPLVILSGSLLSYSISFLMSQKKTDENKIYQLVAKYSFGIYLYSDPLNYLILWIAVHTAGVVIFTNNFYAGIFLTVRLMAGLGLSLLISHMLSKLKLKYLY